MTVKVILIFLKKGIGIYISKVGDQYCNERATNNQRYSLKEYGENRCIALKKINKPSAKYAVKSSSSIIESKVPNSIRRYSTLIYSLETNDVLSERVSYQMGRHPVWGLDGGPYSCKTYSDGKSASISIFDALGKFKKGELK